MRDIYEGTVDIQDVLVIVARTDFDPDNDGHWSSIWKGYGGGNTGGGSQSGGGGNSDLDDEIPF